MSEKIVTVTEAAAFQIKDMMKENEEEGSFLRVAVKGGGCSGLSYGMGFEQEVNGDDLQDEQHGIGILIKKEDAPILNGVKIDFKQSLMGGGFTIDNPNAIASCGCGSSFRTATAVGTPEEC
ncbi:HesB/IscA family protein [Ferdinandcohnia quinoae]|uniref:Iron-sulfur cluster assembly accessory protein n=1 Tax=Fredinandcohnia quinoae TaxID=2918902 RepID=A0AAW5DZM4_9BACI|nr:iron-sulfur cluster assembly accessory protein [Fredinandcohnia sp. SECRCQ15]MCH1625528.1 iron-sulfur cluster assembly accessory protein [Fredinandcohnia sp. SECRCQ15]